MRRSLIVVLALALFPATASARPLPLDTGSAKIAFDVDFGLKLVKFGVTPGAIAPSVQDGLVVTLPIREGGHMRRDGRRATIDTAGGVSQVGSDFEVLLQQLRFNIRGRTARLSALTAINGLETDRFTFAKGTAKRARRTAGGYVVRELELALNDIGAATLNAQLKTDQFAVGEVLGVASITARR